MIRRLTTLLATLLCLLALAAPGWALTDQQLDKVKAEIVADPALAALMAQGAELELANQLNRPAVPDFVVWRTAVTINEVGKAFVATGLSAMTSLNNDRLVSFALYNQSVDPSRADQRAFFDDVFSPTSGASTRTALAALWKRVATRVEKVLATGTGTTASPATLGFEGTISPADVGLAIRRP